MLLDAILKAINDIEAVENRSEELERVLNDLKDVINSKMKQNLLEFMSVGNKMGYEGMKKQLSDLINFIELAEESKKK